MLYYINIMIYSFYYLMIYYIPRVNLLFYIHLMIYLWSLNGKSFNFYQCIKEEGREVGRQPAKLIATGLYGTVIEGFMLFRTREGVNSVGVIGCQATIAAGGI